MTKRFALMALAACLVGGLANAQVVRVWASKTPCTPTVDAALSPAISIYQDSVGMFGVADRPFWASCNQEEPSDDYPCLFCHSFQLLVHLDENVLMVVGSDDQDFEVVCRTGNDFTPIWTTGYLDQGETYTLEAYVYQTACADRTLGSPSFMQAIEFTCPVGGSTE